VTDEKSPPTAFPNPLESWSDLVERQVKMARAFPTFGLAPGTAAFKARVQKGGRLSIPDAERDALGLEEGDLVQVFVVPLSKRKE
jgi:hypothetical protein